MRATPFPCVRRRPPWAAAALLALTALAGAADAPVAPGAKLVFAHYMVCFTQDVAGYRREIALARRHGIDGFALNVGEWLGNPNYVAAAERMYEAARADGGGFLLFMSPDANGPAAQPDNVVDLVRRFADHPNQLRHDGRPVLSAWAGDASLYAPALARLAAEGKRPFFVPFLWSPPFATNWSERAVRRCFASDQPADGLFYFACDGTAAEQIRTNATARRATLELGKLFMAGACPAYDSPNLRDQRGLMGYAKTWEGFIRDGADWVEVVTWNDYQEDSNLMPWRWSSPPDSEPEYLDRDESPLDLTGWLSAWFKTGVRPPTTQDKLYYAYRTRRRDQQRGWSPTENRWIDATREEGGYHVVEQIHDDVDDRIWVTTLLTAPAELVITVGGVDTVVAQPAGLAHASAPLAPGAPRFVLRRAGATVLAVDGRKQVIGEPTERNSATGRHLLNRLWTGGAAAGAARRLTATAGALVGAATVVGDAVRIPTGAGNAVALAAPGLTAGTYAVRVVYRNADADEARLSLVADGASPFPLLLPATAGEPRAAGFLWSVPDGATTLTIACRAVETGPEPRADAADRGDVLIEALELTPVAPVAPAAAAVDRPDLVAVPGGAFRMGGDGGEPDERPAHTVTLAPFALGRCEVTNADYERCAPAHRALRDGYSWRDADPVIYVSWRDAARYCNWLSQRHGLTPAYDEASWRLTPGADGFRLPSEAQWDYVASGRGENRVYPWGDEPPTPDRLHAALAQALDVDDALLGRGVQGVAPVGSFPTGASRDGVLDLAGNVAEWCADAYAPYPADAQVDPLPESDDRYRVVRGGSWGYYGHGQRAADREFNSPGYPGYIYLGFRVALPQAGLDRLTAAR